MYVDGNVHVLFYVNENVSLFIKKKKTYDKLKKVEKDLSVFCCVEYLSLEDTLCLCN